MENRIEELRKRFVDAQTDAEREAIDIEMDMLVNENQTEFENAMLVSIQETNRKVEDEILRTKLQDILPAISVSYFAKKYFQKTPQWFYQRLNGNAVNGKAAKFTNDELRMLANGLTDTANRINQSVSFVV